jgi:serine/threonine protein kinase
MIDATTFTVDGTTIGTVAYMAPEQLEDHSVGPAADIWSLGMVLLECLTGRRVYEGTSAEIIARRLAGPVPLPGDLPVPWKLLLSGMLDHRPEQRLDGAQVASMLTSPAFSVPWTPSPESEAGSSAPTAPLDLTALEPGRQYQAGATTPAGMVGVAPTAAFGVPAGGATQVAPAGVPPPPVIARADRKRPRRVWPVVLGVVVGLAVAGLAAYEIYQHENPAPVTNGTGTHHPPATTTTSTSTTTTTTTTTTQPPTPSSALGQLVADVTSGEEAGTVQQGVGQSLTQQAQQAVTDEQSGAPQQAANDLQQAATIISSGEQNSTISQSAATTLQNDLDALASTLGLGAASQAPATTTTTAPGLFGPAHKHNGPGNGNGPGG